MGLPDAPASTPLEKTIFETHGDVREIKVLLKNVTTIVERHDRALYGGNGDGDGIISLSRATAKQVAEDHKLLHGEDDDPGIKGNVNELMKKAEEQYKLKWLVIGSLVGTAFSIITLIITH